MSSSIVPKKNDRALGESIFVKLRISFDVLLYDSLLLCAGGILVGVIGVDVGVTGNVVGTLVGDTVGTLVGATCDAVDEIIGEEVEEIDSNFRGLTLMDSLKSSFMLKIIYLYSYLTSVDIRHSL